MAGLQPISIRNTSIPVAGIYTVNLMTGNAYGENLTVKTDYITVTSLSLPVADFNANTTSGKVPLAVEFTDIFFRYPQPAGAGRSGMAEHQQEQNPVHVYTTTGQFTVTLQVTNEDGSNTTTKEQFITGSTCPSGRRVYCQHDFRRSPRLRLVSPTSPPDHR